MALVNIDTSNDDPFYRYKMPKLIAKIEGKGNGIKTVIVNMADIAKALNRPASYPTKFFGTERGAQVNTKGDKYIVNGKYDEKELQELLDKFIKKYVLCPECGNPETNMRVSKSKNIIQGKCVACGNRFQFDDAHAVANFIKKNPPTDEYSIATKNAGAARDEEKEKKKKDKDAEKADKKAERKAAKEAAGVPSPKPEKKKSKKPKEEEAGEDDDEDWSQDTSEEAVRARREQLEQAIGTSVSGLVHTEADYFEMSPEDRLEAFKRFAQQPHSSKELFEEAQRLDVEAKAMGVLLPLKFNESIVAQLKQKPNFQLLQRFCINNQETQRNLLGATEKLVSVTFPTLLSKVSAILNAYYSNDIVEESVFFAWAEAAESEYVSSKKHKAVVEAATQFMDWLKTAEEEEDSDEDDGIGFEKGEEEAVPEPKVAYGMQRGMVAAKKQDDDDDLDIDDI